MAWVQTGEDEGVPIYSEIDMSGNIDGANAECERCRLIAELTAAQQRVVEKAPQVLLHTLNPERPTVSKLGRSIERCG